MRVLSWLGGLLVVFAIATGGVATVAHRDASAHKLTAAKQVVVTGIYLGQQDPVDPKTRHPEPDPTPPAADPAAAAPAPPPAPAPVPAPRPAIVVNSTQQALINQDRAANGLGPLTWNGCLYNVAVANAHPAAKAAADDSTLSNVDDGVAVYLERLG